MRELEKRRGGRERAEEWERQTTHLVLFAHGISQLLILIAFQRDVNSPGLGRPGNGQSALALPTVRIRRLQPIPIEFLLGPTRPRPTSTAARPSPYRRRVVERCREALQASRFNRRGTFSPNLAARRCAARRCAGALRSFASAFRAFRS